MKLSRRKFTRVLALSAVAAPFAAEAAAQVNTPVSEDTPVSDETIDLDMKVVDVNVSEKRAAIIREALKNTAIQVEALRAYPLKRDAQPALILSVFDA
jgi:hypothetical protein